MIAKTRKEFIKYFNAEIMPSIREIEASYKRGRYSVDYCLRSQEWINLIDSLVRDRQLPKQAIDWCYPF